MTRKILKVLILVTNYYFLGIIQHISLLTPYKQILIMIHYYPFYHQTALEITYHEERFSFIVGKIGMRSCPHRKRATPGVKELFGYSIYKCQSHLLDLYLVISHCTCSTLFRDFHEMSLRGIDAWTASD